MATGGNAAHAVNPFRYRGYYFDTETNLYYLQSRYYNPESCYAISATRSWPASNGANAYAGFDQYIQVGSWGW